MESNQPEAPKEVDNVECCFQYLNSPVSAYFLPPQIKDVFRLALDDIKFCIDSLNKNEVFGEFNYKNIETGINILLNLQTELTEDEKFHSFIRSYIYLSYNVNKNTLNSSIVDNKCSQVLRYIEHSLTFNETLILFKEVSNKLKGWKEYLPPAFRLSEHYYKLIQEE